MRYDERRMVPYFPQPTLEIGPLTLHAFGVIVAGALLLGMEVGRRRLRAVGASLGADDERLVWYVVAGGLLGAHWFSLIFYFPDTLANDPWSLLRIWEDLSSFGSMVGGLVGVALFLRWRRQRLTTRQRWLLIDVVVYAFALALTLGRLACTAAHDHPGTITDFPLAISLQSDAARAFITDVYAAAGRAVEVPPAAQLATLGFHDLGWYELLYLAIVVAPAMVWAARRRLSPGSLLLLFITLYMPARFLLDFLRVSDARYVGFTPAQWAALAFLAAVPFLWRRRPAAA